MSGSARDVQLVIRARNEVKATVAQVAQSVAELTQRLNEQITAASKAEITFQELAATQQALGKQDSTLLRQKATLDLFRDLSARLDEQTAKATQSRTAYNALAASLDGVAKKTREQKEALSAANAQARADERAVSLTSKNLDRRTDDLKNYGIDVKDVAAAELRLIQITNDLARAQRAAGEAVGGFGAQQRAIKQSRADAAGNAQFQSSLEAGRRTLKEIEYTKLFAQALDDLDAKEKALAASNALAEKAAKDEAAAARSLAAFRALAQNAGQLSTGFQAPVRPANSIQSEASVAAAVERIVAPATAARRTLQGLQDQIATLTAASAVGGRPIQEYADLLRGLEQAQRALGSQAAGIDAFRAQAAAVGQSRASFEAAREAVKTYAAQIASATAEDAALVQKLRDAEAAMARFAAQTKSGITAARELKTGLAAAGIDTRKLGDAQKALLTESAKVAPAMTNLAKVVRDGVAPGGTPTLFGLRPYQLQNLGYQINDVFTQIASGTSITQTLAQQGGQILQIFPGAFSAIGRLAPALVAVGVPLGLIVAGVVRLTTLQGALREFSGALAVSADGVDYQAQSLVRSQQALRGYGAGFDEAGKALRIFIDAQVNPQRIDAFARAAQNLSDVMGIKLVDAAKQVADGFTGDAEAIDKLNRQYNFLTETQAKAIAQSFQEGDAAKARKIAFEAFATAVQKGQDEAIGPIERAFRSLREEFNKLLDALAIAPTILNIAVGGFDLLTAAVNSVRSAVGGLSVEEKLKRDAQGIAVLNDELKRLQSLPAENAFQLPLARIFGRVSSVTSDSGAPVEPRMRAVREEIERRTAALNADTEAARKNAAALTPPNVPAGDRTATRPVLGTGPVVGGDAGAISGAIGAATDLAAARGQDNQATAQQLANAPRIAEALRREALQRVSVRDATRAQIEAKIKLAGQEAADRVNKENGPPALAASARAEAEIAERKKIAAELGRIGEAAAAKEKAKAEELMNYLHKLEMGNTKFLEGTLEDRLRTFDESVKRMRDRITDFGKHFKGTIEGLSMAEFKKRFEDAVAAARKLEEIKFLGDGLKALNSEVTNFGTSVADQVKRGTLTASEGMALLRQNASLVGPEMIKLAQSTVAATDKLIAAGKLDPFSNLQRRIAQGIIETRGQSENGTGGTEAETIKILEAGYARLNQLLETRRQIIQEQTLAVTEGGTSQAAAEATIKAAYGRTDEEIRKIIASLKEANQTARDAGAIGETAFGLWEAKLANVTQQAKYLDPEMKTLVAAIRSALPEAGTEFFRSVTQSIGAAIVGTKTWGQAFQGVKIAMLNFFASFLQKIAEAILQAQLLKLATSLFGGTPFGDLLGLGSGAAEGATGITQVVDSGAFNFHGGGMIGQGTTNKRALPAAWFASAPRFHGGGFPGLSMNEVAVVAKRGEEVLSEKDPRNALNGGLRGGGAQAPINIRSVLVADPSFVASQMSSSEGERAIVSVLRRNVATIREIVR